MIERLDAINNRYDEINSLLMQPETLSDMEKTKTLSKELSDLEETVTM